LRTSKAPTPVDLQYMSLHGCVAKDVKIELDSTYDENTTQFSNLFPNAFEYAMANARRADAGLWVLIAREYQSVRVVPKAKPTGADLIEFKTERSKKNSASIYIGESGDIFDL
ncbi:hypothetical protein B0H13DRAFT_1626509, partial [Mycena leptocephala]